MANKRLHSIQFPGLSDNYTIPQTAEEVQYDGTTSDLEATNVQDAIDETITDLKNGAISVGHSESTASIDSDVGMDDQTPFSYQTSGGESDLTTGVQKFLKLVGCDIIENQIAGHPITSGETTSVTCTLGADYSITLNGTSTGREYYCSTPVGGFYKDHIYLLCGASNLAVHTADWDIDTSGRAMKIVTATKNQNNNLMVECMNANITFNNVKFHVYAKDLTQRYGSNTVVNAIIGNGTQEEKVANLLKFDAGILLNNDYNTSTFVPSKSAKLECSGYNLLKDELSAVGTSTTSVTKNLVHPIIASGKVLGIVATTNALVPFVELFSNTTNLGFVYLNETNSNGEKYGYMASAIQVGTPITSIKFYYDGSHGTSGSFTYSDIAVFNYWDGSKITYEAPDYKNYPLPNRTMHGILKVDGNGKIYADGDELLPNGTGEEKYVIETYNGSETWQDYTNLDSDMAGVQVGGLSPAAGGTDDDRISIITNLGIAPQLTPAYSRRYGITQINTTLFVTFPKTMFADTAAWKTYLSTHNLIVVRKVGTSTPITGEQTFTATPHVDDFGTMMFQDENGVQIAGLQGNEIFYKANVAGFAESVYVKANGDPDDLATVGDVATVDTKVDTVQAIINENIGGALRHQLVANVTAGGGTLDFDNTDWTDLGTLNWVYYSTYDANVFVAAISNRKQVQNAPIICPKYKTNSASAYYSLPDKTISTNDYQYGLATAIFIKDLSFNGDADAFKASVKGILAAYEKATE